MGVGNAQSAPLAAATRLRALPALPAHAAAGAPHSSTPTHSLQNQLHSLLKRLGKVTTPRCTCGRQASSLPLERLRQDEL